MQRSIKAKICMNSLRQLSRILLLVSVFCPLHASFADASGIIPDARDKQVLETLLQHLLSDKKFNLTDVAIKNSTIVLHVRTPTNSAYVQTSQTRADIGDHTLPEDALLDLLNRNSKPETKPEDHEATTASFKLLTFGPGIVVADLTAIYQEGSFQAFKDAHPTARGFVNAYLPGYSKKGTLAIVRAGIDPWPHGAMVTALLEKTGDKWIVKWHHLTFYA
jgi:hypothetical protein